MIAFRIWPVAFLLLVSAGRAQVTSIYGVSRDNIHRLNLTNNTPEMIRQELLDTNTARIIAKFNGLSEEDLASVQIRQENGEVTARQTGNSFKAYHVMSEQLRTYAATRNEGHTRDFCLALLTNKTDLPSLTDPHLRAFLKGRPMLPANWLTNHGSTTFPIKAGTVLSQTTTTTFFNGKLETTNVIEKAKVDEVGQRITYVLADGEVAWVYAVLFRADGSEIGTTESRRDAKEYDLDYGPAIKEVEDQTTAEMKKEGKQGPESAHLFWSRVQKKLKDQGINWHSPEDLNPN